MYAAYVVGLELVGEGGLELVGLDEGGLERGWVGERVGEGLVGLELVGSLCAWAILVLSHKTTTVFINVTM